MIFYIGDLQSIGLRVAQKKNFENFFFGNFLKTSELSKNIFWASSDHVGVFLTAPKTWIRPLFLDFFENRRNYAISMVHNVFQGHLEVAEHVFDIIFMFHHVFDSV